MKVKASVKPICDKCRVIKRKGKVILVREANDSGDIIHTITGSL